MARPVWHISVDSHARNQFREPHPNGAAVWVYLESLQSLSSFIQNTYTGLVFNIVSVVFNTLEHGNQNGTPASNHDSSTFPLMHEFFSSFSSKKQHVKGKKVSLNEYSERRERSVW